MAPKRPLAPVTAAVLLLCLLAWATLVPQAWDSRGVLTWAWPVIVVLVVLVESVQVHVEVRRETVSLSLSELPLVLGLFLLDPLPLLLARVTGGLGDGLRHRSTPEKSAFNAGLFCTEVTLASVVFAALRGDDPHGPQAWVAAYAATLVVSAVTGALLLQAVVRLQGRAPGGDALLWLRPLFVGALVSTSAALLAVVVWRAQPEALPLVVLMGVLLVVGHRTYGRLLRRHQMLQLLQSFTAALGAGAGTASLISEALAHARALLAADCVQVVVSTADGRLRSVRQRGTWEGTATPEQLAGVVAQVLADGRARRVVRRTTDLRECEWLRAQDLRDVVVVPMVGTEGVRGALLVGQRLGETSSFRQDDVDLLEMVATHLEIALRSAELVERLREEATHDALTGLPNRVLLHERLSAAIGRRSPDSGFAVLLMDLDGFKDVNDTLGHDSGDQVLVQVARRLISAVPDDVTVARLGGDEFCLLVPLRAAGPDVPAVVDRLHARLRAPLLVSGVELEVRASVGAALCPEHGDDSSSLLRHADSAMYAAKAAQVELVVYGPETERTRRRRLALLAGLADGTSAVRPVPAPRRPPDGRGVAASGP